MKKFIYEDPTGGGDDIEVIAPDWVEGMPDMIVAYQGPERYEFYGADTEEDDE